MAGRHLGWLREIPTRVHLHWAMPSDVHIYYKIEDESSQPRSEVYRRRSAAQQIYASSINLLSHPKHHSMTY